MQIFDAIGIVLAQCLEGAGATPWVMRADFVIQWLFLLPLAYLLTIVLGWGLVGAWASIGFGMVLYALVMVWKFRGDSWMNITA